MSLFKARRARRVIGGSDIINAAQKEPHSQKLEMIYRTTVENDECEVGDFNK